MRNSLKNKAATLALAEVRAKVVVTGRHEKERHAIVDAIEKISGNDFILPDRCDETRFIVPVNVFKAIEFRDLDSRSEASSRRSLRLHGWMKPSNARDDSR